MAHDWQRGRSRPSPVLLLAVMGLAVAVGAPLLAASLLDEFGELAERMAAIPPTPMGDGHVGRLESAAHVQLRFPVPRPRPLVYALSLANVVAYTGKGTSYQLILRRDAPDGPVVYKGPVVTINGDAWNAANRRPIDITTAITDADAKRGYIDIFVSATTADDGWTVYRHSDRRPICAIVLGASDNVRRAVEQQKAMAERGIAVIPAPQQLTPRSGEFTLTPRSRIVLARAASTADRFAASDLVEQLEQTCGIRPSIVVGAEARSGDIILAREPTDLKKAEAYRLSVTANRVRAAAKDEAGLFYAAQTIAQLVTPQGTIPCLTIRDWPAFKVRGVQYDVARGQTVNVQWWKRVIRTLARFKLNTIMIYGENDYHFRSFPYLGREGTFTPEKAAELSQFARRYHLQLIPQFESLGHAAAVLSHEELADLREAGSRWVFCTSNPRTWEFLDRVFEELCQQFPDARYLHVGADEFEMAFGKCPACRAKVKEKGYAGLYAEHMNRLNELVRKRGRTMLFWPSHGGPTRELSYLTIKAHQLMDRRCIPTEWIYHGPPAYPQIKQYQELGFEDVWASPAVVCSSRIWPDYRTTYRGIRGFLRAGAERGIGGAMTTTWEWMYGGVVANSLLGMVYAAECAWSLGNTTVADFERRFGQQFFGMGAAEASGHVHEVFAEPWPQSGPAAVMRNGRLMRDVLWEGPRTLRPRRVLCSRALARPAAEAMLAAANGALGRLERIAPHVKRNSDLLKYTRLAFTAYRLCAAKLLATDDASRLYADASARMSRGDASAAAQLLDQAADRIVSLAADLEYCAKGYQVAVEELGAYSGDVKGMRQQLDETKALAEELRQLGAKCRAGQLKALPPAARLGLVRGRGVRIGTWQPKQMSEQGCEIRIDVTGKIPGAGEIVVAWEYKRGAHGVYIDATTLLENGREVARDEHRGWSGASTRHNIYRLKLHKLDPDAKYEIVGKLRSSGGTDSYGEVWLFVPE